MTSEGKPTEKVGKDQDYQTPNNILQLVRSYYYGEISLDPATTPLNPTKAKNFFTPEENGLLQNWLWPTFVNPPYNGARDWYAKIQTEAMQGTPIIALLPVNRSEQQYFQDMISTANTLCFIRKRVAFIRPSTGEVAKGNPYNSWVWGFNMMPERFLTVFQPLGRCITIGS